MSNKFQGFFEARKGKEEPEQPAEEPTVKPTEHGIETPRRVGRPVGGKKSNPDYQQVTAYVRKQTYQDAQVKLLRQGTKQDFSELVEELLSKWLQK